MTSRSDLAGLQSPDSEVVPFIVPGIPAPQGSKRHVGNGRLVESSKKLGPWRKTVTTAAQIHMCGRPPMAGPASVSIEFVLYRPKATKRQTPPAIKYPDVDKLTRAIFDGIGGVIVLNDSQITEVHATKRIAELDEQPHARITVTAL